MSAGDLVFKGTASLLGLATVATGVWFGASLIKGFSYYSQMGPTKPGEQAKQAEAQVTLRLSGAAGAQAALDSTCDLAQWIVDADCYSGASVALGHAPARPANCVQYSCSQAC
ncbi:hypothetical protein WJX72_003698 [[Myrmecia] bisecta]|uniref:Uncharacterized protein n=1 Tax=[Myrmecia] bisecta TaxID=41462 RepID=A0AAW1R5Z1_9CHLO